MDKNRYREAGVNVEAGYESVELIKKHIKRTNNIGVMSQIGSFGALFDLNKYNFKDPVLVSATDGVGTKVEIAKEMGIFDTVGIDLVAMCVNDLAAMKAKPLFFLDYIAVDKNIPTKIESIVKGICNGLEQCDCALIGGETAEMPGVYKKDGFDLAGFAVGVVERKDTANENEVEVGQILVGLPSNGLHANGFSLVRKIIEDCNLSLKDVYSELDPKLCLGEVLLKPTRIYVNEITRIKTVVDIKAIAHITGGGFYENIKRVTGDLGVNINASSLPKMNIFSFLEQKANLIKDEMYGCFNMGIGLVMIVDKKDVAAILNTLDDAIVIGEVVSHGAIKVC